ncbi:hypothetical protein ASG89_33395 [Paenibacillus sp. Soil766]|uniref:Ger(x)C family spore germination protein n=1 Tax=Paenibacillus sp. Soil766 TaxID=1736404 RepID=UPI00070E6D3B|nr:Ger(x)C family spore germination protein [Paenibacillus sp. Soil766]KRE92149.1 hypothetical protein ASG89_33395 [Paenibacillus sp. Soil766]
MMMLMCMALLSGCWNRMELNELGITSATGFDRANGEWLMAYQVIVPSVIALGSTSGSGGSGAAVHVFTTQGKTISHALNRSYLENARYLYFAHNNVLIIGQEAAKEGISPIIDLYFRNTDSRESVYVVISEGKASDILKKLVPPENLPGSAISEILQKEGRLSGYFPPIKMYELAKQISSDSKSAGVPEIVIAGEEGNELESLDIFKKTSSKEKLKLSRLSVFEGDRLVGWMNWRESYGVSWLSDKIKRSSITFSCPESDPQNKNASIRISSARTQVTPIKDGKHFTMQIKVKAEGGLSELTCKGDLTEPRLIEKLEDEIEKEINNYINIGWEAVRKLKADLPGFAGYVHRKYPKEWNEVKENWKEKELGEIKLDVQVNVKIKHPGFISNSYDLPDGEEGK